ncbi:integrase, catalytic region, zinc finger, CCHC-type containing protein [Tanacetum coccineum]
MHLGTTHEGGVFLDRKGLVHMRTSVTRRRNNTMPMSMPPILCFKDFPKISTSSSITNIRSKSNLGQRHMLKAGSELTIEDRESQLYDEFERFKMLPDNRISKNYSDGGFCSECSRETESELEPKHSQNSDYFKDKMLLMQAQENGTVLDEEELLFLADECDAFDSDVDDEPTAQSGQQIHKLVHPMHQSYLSNVTPYEQYLSDNDIFGVPSCASSALSSVYDQKTKTALVCGELELAEVTRNKLHVKMNDSVCVEKRVNITPPNYSKENFMATFTPQTQLTPEQVFWSLDLAKQKAKEYKANCHPTCPTTCDYSKKNREVHLHYIERLKEHVGTLHEIVDDVKVERPLDTSLASTCHYTKHSQELLEYVIGTCPKDFGPRVKGASAASRSKPRSNTKKDRTLPAKSALKQVEAHSSMNKSDEKHKNHVDSSISYKRNGIPPKVLPTKQWKPTGRLLPLGKQCPLVKSTALKSDCLPADPQEPVAPVAYNLACTNQPDRNCNWGSNVSNSPFSPLFKCRNFGKKCLFGTVRFGNDHFGAIMRYVDYVIDLEVAFRKHTCFVQDLDGVDRIKGSRVDDYSRFTWVKFLRSKDETPIFVINLLKQLQVGLNKTVWFVRTDFGTEFVNKNLLISMKCVALLTRRTFRELSAEMGLLNEESHLLKLLGYVIFSKASIVFFGAAAVAGQRYKGAWRISGISPVCFN